MKEHITEWTVVDSQSNATATATKAAPSASKGMKHYITFVAFSASAAPAAAVTVLVRENAATTLFRVDIPASATAPVMINFVKPIRATQDLSVDATVGALGAGVTGTVVLGGYTATS